MHLCVVKDGQRSWLVHLLALALNWLQSYYDLLREASSSEDVQGAPGGGNHVVGTVDPRLQDCKLVYA